MELLLATLLILVFVIAVLGVIAQQKVSGVGVFIKIDSADGGYRVFVDKVLCCAPATGLLWQGDQIIAVGETRLVGSSRWQVRKLSKKILGSEGSVVKLTVIRCTDEVVVEITRARLRF